MIRVYRLEFDYDHSGDSERDAYHIPFKDDAIISGLLMSPKYADIPDKIFFQANFNMIPLYDYPLTDLNIPIFSKRMMKVIETFGSFEYRKVDVIMIDDTYSNKLFDSNGDILSDVPINIDYISIQLKTRFDCVDYEKTIFKKFNSQPNKLGLVRKLVLKDLSVNYPPIFRINEKPSSLFVSAEAKEALEAANIKGCVFEPVETS
ncbi:MAG: hypothetical protein N4A49_16365 [Marinifilaceae bacterium]|jgi:hypothetical protein|nr:hypothetical protein [Marinifilaceae bacterium]